MIDAGNEKGQVCINKSTFRHPFEYNGCIILRVEDAVLGSRNMADDADGETIGRDGSEAKKNNLILFGENRLFRRDNRQVK